MAKFESSSIKRMVQDAEHYLAKWPAKIPDYKSLLVGEVFAPNGVWVQVAMDKQGYLYVRGDRGTQKVIGYGMGNIHVIGVEKAMTEAHELMNEMARKLTDRAYSMAQAEADILTVLYMECVLRVCGRQNRAY